MNKWGLIVEKKEMTKVWKNGKFISATMVKVLPQEIVRYKTNEKDWYSAVVVWVEKKDLKKEKWQKVKYKKVVEFRNIDETYVSEKKVGTVLDDTLFDGVDSVTVVGTSKGKGYQWVMKRFHAKGWPKTHGSKFHRHIGSLGNRKPRRTQKWHPHAGHMGSETITLKNIKIVDTINNGEEKILLLVGSLPGSYNGMLKFVVE